MKKLSLALTALVVITQVSCVETSSKYKKLLACKDSVVAQNKLLEKGYLEAFDLLNQVEDGFLQISKAQNNCVNIRSQNKDRYMSQKDLIRCELTNLQKLLRQNKTKIRDLEERLSEVMENNPAIRSTVDRMQKELTYKERMIDSLQKVVGSRDVSIAEFRKMIGLLQDENDLSKTHLTEAKTQETRLNKELDELNTVYICLQPISTLKREGILRKNGLFGKTSLNREPLTQHIKTFKAADLRKTLKISLETENIRIFSPHPKDSYNISTDENGLIWLYITHPKAFWSQSRYLVISQD